MPWWIKDANISSNERMAIITNNKRERADEEYTDVLERDEYDRGDIFNDYNAHTEE